MIMRIFMRILIGIIYFKEKQLFQIPFERELLEENNLLKKPTLLSSL